MRSRNSGAAGTYVYTLVCNYPPAEPGALGSEPLKAAEGSLAAPRHSSSTAVKPPLRVSTFGSSLS
jgi:hypothetical protein